MHSHATNEHRISIPRVGSSNLSERATCDSTPEHAGVSRCAPAFPEMLKKALFGALVGGRWDVAPKVHSVVEDTHDFDRALRRDPVHQEMASPTAAPRNVERAKACHDLVPGPRVRYIGTVGKLANRLNKGIPIDARLSRAKILGAPFEDVGKVDFCGSAETNVPSSLGHEALYSALREMTFSERSFK